MIVESFLLQPGPVVPNNETLPVVLYRQAIGIVEDRAVAFEEAFRRNGWQGLWRNGIFAYHHYHAHAHEVLGIACGSGKVLLGGPGGLEFTVAAGDCIVLPAGTGHCRTAASPDFLVVGGYPPGQNADMQTEAPNEALREAIRACPLPARDPVDGSDSGLSRLWRNAP